MLITGLKLILINTLEILVAALTGGLLIALGDHFMKHRMPSDFPVWRDYAGRALFYAAVLWFNIYTSAIFVLFIITEVILRVHNLSFGVILFVSMLLFALIAAGIWQEAYSYSGINKWEKRLKNTLSLMAASILYAFYIRWLLRRQWTRFTD